MNIHEYQAKQLLASYGAPIAEGRPVLDIAEAEAAITAIAGKSSIMVVKSQIHAGGRGKGKFKGLGDDAKGGVRVAASPDEALAHAKEMLGGVLVTKQTGPKGKEVRRLYIEAGADISCEHYLSMLVDRETGKISFVASTEGGMDIETVAAETPDKIHNIAIDGAITDKDKTALADALQLDGAARDEAMTLFGNLHKAFTEKDMSLLEINPLIVTKDNHIQLLDAKISFDGNALFRHPDIMELRDTSEEDSREIEASQHDLAYIALDGDIGCMVNGAGLAMATMDIIKLYGAEPANFLDVGGGASTEKVTAAFKIITSDASVKGILVNIFGGIMRCDVIAEGIVEAAKQTSITVPLVVRLEGTKVTEGKKILEESGLDLIPADDLDDAARKIVKAVRG